MADVLSNPIVIGLLIGLPSVVLGYLGYWRSQKADKVAEASGAIAGWDKLIDNLQQDNAVLRTERDELKRRIVALGGMVGIVSLIVLGVESVKQDQERLVTRAARVARAETAADTQQEVDALVDDKVEALGITTTTYAPLTTTTTLYGPYAPSTTTTTSTTTTSTTQPLLPAVTTTTVTIPITLPTTIPEVPIP